MTRSLGFHLYGGQVAYALVEAMAESAPQVLAAGVVSKGEVGALYRKLSAGRNLPWCLASAQLGVRRASLPSAWPLPRSQRPCLLHPAVAAAHWDWSHGRIDGGDLYLWLRAASLHWNRGQPGRGRAGTVPRQDQLRVALGHVLRRTRQERFPAVLYVEGDAPGGELVQELLESLGHQVRRLRRPPEEMGASPAAAGAGLAALDAEFPGVYAPAPRQRAAPWRSAMGLLALLSVLAGSGLSLVQESRLRAWERSPAQPAEALQEVRYGAPPVALQRLLKRRQAVLDALAGLPAREAEFGPIAEMEILSAADSDDIHTRVRHH